MLGKTGPVYTLSDAELPLTVTFPRKILKKVHFAISPRNHKESFSRGLAELIPKLTLSAEDFLSSAITAGDGAVDGPEVTAGIGGFAGEEEST